MDCYEAFLRPFLRAEEVGGVGRGGGLSPSSVFSHNNGKRRRFPLDFNPLSRLLAPVVTPVSWRLGHLFVTHISLT